MEYINEFTAYFQAAWPNFLNVECLIPFGVIALILGFATSTAGRLIFVPIVGALLFVAVETVIPAATEGQDVVLPVVDKTFAYQFATLYILFIVPIAVVFGIKKLIEAIRG